MDTNLDITTTISSVPLFYDLSQSQVEKIAGITDLVELDPGEQPIREGSQLDFLYILLEGEIRVDIFVPTRGSIETCKLGPLDVLGWSSLTPIIRQRTATSTALTHCWLLRINSKMLTALCEKEHDIGFLIYRRVANVTAMSLLSTRLQLMNLIAESL